MTWDIVYKSAYNKDGSLLFPERLSKEFLESARRSMGPFLFANQYLNQAIPDDAKKFRREWLTYYPSLPDGCNAFAFIDPAIGQKDHHDYTGIVVVDAAVDKQWYFKYSARLRLTPTEICEKIFQLFKEFNLKGLGVETVAYQESILYILDEMMRQRDVILPVKGVTRKAISKNSRILGLVPRFEWGRISCRGGMVDFEDEYHTFPRGSHDDLLDALASIEEIIFYPEKEKKDETQQPPPHAPDYERWYIRQLASGHSPRSAGDPDGSDVG